MLQQPCTTFFLHVYDVESGLWVHTTLGSGVSPRIQEAMNTILQKDGILAFIGTRSEFGHYLSELKNTHGADFRHCWTSLPASTIMSMLGLCLHMPTSGRPELVFNGNPLTLMLAYLLDMRKADLLDHVNDEARQVDQYGYLLDHRKIYQIGAYPDVLVNASEYHEACSYLEESA